jgi:hypothetical protein
MRTERRASWLSASVWATTYARDGAELDSTLHKKETMKDLPKIRVTESEFRPNGSLL